jgi:hypothetical protein
LRNPDPYPPPNRPPPVYTYITLGDGTVTDTGLFNHITQLRHLVVNAESATTQYEAAVLLLDLYETILEQNGLLIFSNGGYTKH